MAHSSPELVARKGEPSHHDVRERWIVASLVQHNRERMQRQERHPVAAGCRCLNLPSTSALVALQPVEHAIRLLATHQSAMLQIAYKPSSDEWSLTPATSWRF